MARKRASSTAFPFEAGLSTRIHHVAQDLDGYGSPVSLVVGAIYNAKAASPDLLKVLKAVDRWDHWAIVGALANLKPI